MARNKFFTDVDLTGNQLKNSKPQYVTGTPPVDDQGPWTNITGQDLSANPADGQLAYETISKTLLVYKTPNSTIQEAGWYTASSPDVASLEDNIEDLQEDVEELQNGYFIPGWRTPTVDEWDYIINTRSASTVSGTTNARYAKAQINSINGLILLPDVFELPTGINMVNINASDAAFTGNIYTTAQWETLENAGCIFLPAAGLRYGTAVLDVGTYGYYWSSSYHNEGYAWYVYFYSGDVVMGIDYRYYGQSVRLVQENNLDGLFSTSANTKCNIAKSNLQFHCLNKEWRFAPNAYDVIGNDNSNIAENYNGYIDLFGFGTSGWNSGAVCYQPWSSSTNDADYINHDLTGDYANADWGVYIFRKQLHNVAFSGDYNDLENTPIPIPTVADEGKMLQVNASGQYELVTIVNSELQPY